MRTILSVCIVTSPRICHGDFTLPVHIQHDALARLPLRILQYMSRYTAYGIMVSTLQDFNSTL